MRRIRRSRSSLRRRRPLRLWVWLLAGLIACALLAWAFSSGTEAVDPQSRIVTIRIAEAGALSLDGAPVSLAELERRLTRIKAATPRTSVVIVGAPAIDGAVETLLGRLNLPWLSASSTPAPSAKTPHQGGDHGR